MGRVIDFMIDRASGIGKQRFRSLVRKMPYPYTKEQFRRFIDTEVDFRKAHGICSHEALRRNVYLNPIMDPGHRENMNKRLPDYLVVIFDPGRGSQSPKVVVGDLKDAKSVRSTSYGLLIDDTPIRVDGNFQVFFSTGHEFEEAYIDCEGIILTPGSKQIRTLPQTPEGLTICSKY